MSNTPTAVAGEKKPVVTEERLNQIVVTSVRKLFEEDSRHFLDGYLKHISSKEKVAE